MINMNPQLSRKQEISKGCGKELEYFHRDNDNNKIYWKCGETQTYKWMYCPTCQARLDERIRAEQDFLKMIDERIYYLKQSLKYLSSNEYNGENKRAEIVMAKIKIRDIEELKSTIQKEKKE